VISCRLVHHAIILEFDGASLRTRKAGLEKEKHRPGSPLFAPVTVLAPPATSPLLSLGIIVGGVRPNCRWTWPVKSPEWCGQNDGKKLAPAKKCMKMNSGSELHPATKKIKNPSCDQSKF